jgi:hypothetical protein
MHIDMEDGRYSNTIESLLSGMKYLVDDDLLRRAANNQEPGVAVSVYELREQILSDFEIDRVAAEFSRRGGDEISVRLILDFAKAFRRMLADLSNNSPVEEMIAHPSWSDIQRRATSAIRILTRARQAKV